MKFLVTGAAGFIGYHISKRLLIDGQQVVGLDNMCDYYDISLKESRLNQLTKYNNFVFYKQNLENYQSMTELFAHEKFKRVIHLGAQSGVRYSLENPLSYANANIIGQLNILEGCRHNNIDHLLYASSSSVYGLNCKFPHSMDSTNYPISLYAATKKANELMAYSYSYLYKLPTTGLRFFNVYGPWGRPDSVLFKFTKQILNKQHIDIYNYGEMWRDFTYIDDVIEVIIRLQKIIPTSNISYNINVNSKKNNFIPYHIYNIGNGHSVKLLDYIKILEKVLGINSKKIMLPMQPGDVLYTGVSSEDMDTLYKVINFKPQTFLIEGIKLFVDWYRKYYRL